MALLPILEYPDPRLKKVAAPIEAVTPEIRALVRDMAETMYSAPGIGLAAPQVNVQKRIVVIDISDTKDQLRVFINPVLMSAEGEQECEEGCLSVPGYYEKVRRAAKVSVRAIDLDGQPFELVAEELLAVCLQHEIDHLEGKVFVEYLSPLKQQRLKSRIKKRQREAAAA